MCVLAHFSNYLRQEYAINLHYVHQVCVVYIIVTHVNFQVGLYYSGDNSVQSFLLTMNYFDAARSDPLFHNVPQKCNKVINPGTVCKYKSYILYVGVFGGMATILADTPMQGRFFCDPLDFRKFPQIGKTYQVHYNLPTPTLTQTKHTCVLYKIHIYKCTLYIFSLLQFG